VKAADELWAEKETSYEFSVMPGQERDDICIIDRAEEFDSGLISSEESISIRHFNFSKCK
jgi:hypothetical protein